MCDGCVVLDRARRLMRLPGCEAQYRRASRSSSVRIDYCSTEWRLTMSDVLESEPAAAIAPARWATAIAAVSFVAGALLLVPSGFLPTLLGLVLGSVVPAVALGYHNQRAQARSVLHGEYLSRAFVWTRATVLVLTVFLAGAHGYRFALALESWVLS